MGMAINPRSRFQPVLALLQDSFSGPRGVARAFWEQHLVERLSSHQLTPMHVKEACQLMRSFESAEQYVLDAQDLQDAWSRSLELYAATNQVLAWASELNLIQCTTRQR